MRFPVKGGGFVDIPVRWFFTDNLPLLPKGTVYGSINWHNADERNPSGPGEVIGAARQWTNGRQLDPDCCKGRSLQTGGAAVGGRAEYEFGEKIFGLGGAVANGAGSFGRGFAGGGGGSGDGAGAFGVGARAEGGGSGDGAGAFGRGFAGEGGGSGDGAGSFGRGFAGEGGGSGDGAGSFGRGFAGGGGGSGDGAGAFGRGFAGGGGGSGDGAGAFGSGFAGGGGGSGGGAGSFGSGFAGGGGGSGDGAGDFDSGEIVTTGIMVGWGNSTIPSGWLECNGQYVSQTTYAALYAIIANHFGPVSGGDFMLPDFRSRVMLGQGQGTGLLNYDLGSKGGEEKHTLVATELPAHTHNQAAQTMLNAGPGANFQTVIMGGVATSTGGVTSSVGIDTPHENRQPYLCCKIIIKT